MGLLWIIVCCAVITFAGAYWSVSAWFDRKITGLQLTLLLGAVLVLEFVAIALGGMGVLVLAAGVFGAAALFRCLAAVTDRRLSDSLTREDIARYQAAIGFDAKNVAAHSLLADTYRRLGKAELAVEEYRAALRLDPSLQSERYWVQQLELQLARRATRQMACPRCGTLRPQGAEVCPECSRWYSTAETAAHAVRTMPPGRKLRLAAIIALGILTLLVAAALAPRAIGWAVLAVSVLAPVGIIVLSVRANRRMG